MNPIDLQPVIIAGGSGTRLWPLSRAAYPKQFLALHGRHSLFQQAAMRLHSLAADDIAIGSLCVVGNEEHRFLALDQLAGLQLPPAAVLLEPTGRNTAPAMTLAALHATQHGRDPVLVVTPADQSIGDEAAFTAALQRAVRAASAGSFVILGVAPDRPETGYGYIRCERSPQGEMKVARFVEKPDAETAQAYLREGGYYWNSGMFVVRASLWLQALGQFRPDILAATRAAWDGRSADAASCVPTRRRSRPSPASRSTMR
jgi:mannose-1-phosphate guanylyltransferase / mannose-6-phosphate isomerase